LGCFSFASAPQSARIQVCPERSNDTARAHRFRRRLGFGSPEQRKSAQALAVGTREDIMLDKAPNGKVSGLLNALDEALSAGAPAF
jgi:hypothetical protein